MAESTLSLQMADFQQAIGDFLGFGRGTDGGDTAWSSAQSALVNDFLNSGLRRYYYPALPDGRVYEWSFLKPVATVTLTSGASEADLPDDFNGFVGPLVVVDATDSSWPIPITGRTRQMTAASPTVTGKPLYAEVEAVKGTSLTEGSRYRLRVYPVPDAAYVLQGQYSIHPDALTAANPYVYGGPAHHETVLEACLAAAEQRRDDVLGIHTAVFRERLAASVAQDRRAKPAHLGYNGDRSDGRHALRAARNRWGEAVSFDGTEYD